MSVHSDLGIGLWNASTGTTYSSSSSVIVPGMWHEVEVSILPATTGRSFDLAVDGVEVVNETGLELVPLAVNTTLFGIGWQEVPDGGRRMWLDDITVADEPLP